MDKLVAKGKYNAKSHRSFYLFHLFYKSASTYFLLFLIVGLFVLGIYNTTKALNNGTFSEIYIIWGLIATTLFLTIFQMYSRIKKSVIKEMSERKDSIEVIEITKAVISRRIENVAGREVIGWEELNSIYETKEYIFIYTLDTSGFVIVKDDIIEGSVEDFRKLAQNQMPKNRKGKVKYKIKYKEE